MRLLIALLLLIMPLTSNAQEAHEKERTIQDDIHDPQLAISDYKAEHFTAEGVVNKTTPIRSAPPHGLSNLEVGEEVIKANEGDHIKIVGKKIYKGRSGTNVWYLVTSLCPVGEKEDFGEIDCNKLTAPSELQSKEKAEASIKSLGSGWVYGGVIKGGASSTSRITVKNISPK